MTSRFSVFLPLFLFALPLQAQEAPAPELPPAVAQSKQIARELVEKLIRGGSSQEIRALREIVGVHHQIPAALLQEFEVLKLLPETEKRRIRGPFHMLLGLMGSLRVHEAENQLMEIADFQVDPATAPMGHWSGGVSNYPAALALSNMGGKEVVSSLFFEINRGMSGNKLRAYTWILAQIIGKDVALGALKNKLAPQQKRLAEEGYRSDSLVSLETAIALLESKESILIAPPMAKP